MGRKIAVSYFALEAIVGWCSAKVGVLQKAILKCDSLNLWSEPLKNNCKGYFSSVNPAMLFKDDFLHNYFSRIKTSGVDQLF